METNCVAQANLCAVKGNDEPIIETQRIVLEKIHNIRVDIEWQRDRLCGKPPEQNENMPSPIGRCITDFQYAMNCELDRIKTALDDIRTTL